MGGTMATDEKKVSEFPGKGNGPAMPGSSPIVPVAPENLIFAAMFDPATPAAPNAPRRLNFMLGPSLAAETMTAQQIYVILGELRTQIRKWIAANGNTGLADSL